MLLIDEIDKSDFEFESFLLESLGEKQITIPELGTFECKNNILVFLTSNVERELSEPLKRRCLYLHLDFLFDLNITFILTLIYLDNNVKYTNKADIIAR